MNHFLFALIFAMLLCGCASQEHILATHDEAGLTSPTFTQAWERAAHQNSGDPAIQYLYRWAPDIAWTRNRARLSEKPWMNWPGTKAVSECVTAIFPAIESAGMVFRIDIFGVTVDSITDQAGYLEECVARKSRGIRVPPPPFPGFLLCQRYTRLTDSEYKLEGCGPLRWSSICKRTGASVSCGTSWGITPP
jgi:hypothetical protein